VSAIVTPQGLAAQAAFKASVSEARAVVYDTLLSGYKTVSETLGAAKAAGFSEDAAREAMWQLIDRSLMVVRDNRTLALTVNENPLPAPYAGEPAVDEFATVVAAARAWEASEGLDVRRRQPHDYLERLMAAVASVFEAEARAKLIADGWWPPVDLNASTTFDLDDIGAPTDIDGNPISESKD
jgi:hypothetical protein